MSSLSSIVGLRDAISAEDCGGEDTSGVKDPITTMECGSGSMLGVYEPDPEWLAEQLEKHIRDYSSVTRRKKRSVVVDARTPNRTQQYENQGHYRRSLLAASAIDGSPNTGISNPTICLSLNEVMMFSVDNDNYPKYDK